MEVEDALPDSGAEEKKSKKRRRIKKGSRKENESSPQIMECATSDWKYQAGA